jgi:hypothetical protein
MWANLNILGQPNTFLAQALLCSAPLAHCARHGFGLL